MSDAYNRRVTIITFPNRFEVAREDKQFIAKLTTKSEKSGIFNILMNALRQIRQNKDIYVNEKTIEERRLKYLRVHNSIRAFMEGSLTGRVQTRRHISPSQTYI
jgi:phage/plasmid-associated DNA primase